MSKLQTVKALNDSSQQLQTIEQARQLQEAAHLLRQSLDSLPEAVAQQVSESLQSLDRVSSQVQQALMSFDLVNQAQRQTLESLTERMAENASQSFQEQAQRLGQTVQSQSHQTEKLARAVRGMGEALTDVQALPKRLQAAQQSMNEAAEQLQEAAASSRSRWWMPILQTVLGGLLAGLVVLGGMYALNRPAQPDAAQQRAATFGQQVWNKATPQERELLQQIANRPAN